MKIALPTRDNCIDDHFGHCEYFTVMTVDTDKKEITEQVRVDSPEGCGCKSNIASVLAEMGVGVLLAGNMGQGAVNVLGANGIKVIRGCSGEIADVAAKWLNGEIQDAPVLCDHHNCGHH